MDAITANKLLTGVEEILVKSFLYGLIVGREGSYAEYKVYFSTDDIFELIDEHMNNVMADENVMRLANLAAKKIALNSAS